MTKKENKVNFDLSILTLTDLIKVYEDVQSFIYYLEDKRIEEEKEESDE